MMGSRPQTFNTRPPSSVFSDISSLPSSPTSFQTARLENGTDFSTSPPAASPGWRPVKRLPESVKRPIHINLEEKIYGESITALNALLSVGLPSARRVRVPPTSHISLAATLAIHPSCTSDLRERDRDALSQNALQYLQSLLESAGPHRIPFRQAFQFKPPKAVNSGFRGRGQRIPDELAFEFERPGADLVDHNALAGKNSVWTRAADFWDLVGWAFTCSAQYPARWKYWRSWLEVVFQIIFKDWTSRLEMDQKVPGEPDYKNLYDSIFASYIRTDTVQHQTSPVRYILSSILAGLGDPGTTFSEVFVHEKQSPEETKNKKRKRAEMSTDTKLDVENGKYGDYMDFTSGDSDSDSDANSGNISRFGRRRGAAAAKKIASEAAATKSQTITPDVLQSLPLRLLLISVVSAISRFLPNLPGHLSSVDIHEKFATSLKSFPISVLSEVLNPQSFHMEPLCRRFILRNLLESILPRGTKAPARVNRRAAEQRISTWEILEKCYLPYAALARSPEENAKLSVILECMMQELMEKGNGGDEGLVYSQGLRDAVEGGIRAREERSGMAKRMKAGDKAGMVLLKESGGRLMALLDVVQILDDGRVL